MKLGIISGHYPGRRFNSHVNHSLYSELHGYYYVDASYPGRDRRPHFRKLEVLERYLDLFDWLFWIDDDAYFTDFSKPLHSFLDTVGDAHFLVCKSPSTKETFTKFSGGQFFLRCSPEARQFLRSGRAVDLPAVRRDFWTDRLGIFTQGDQTALVYVTEVDERFRGSFTRLVDHNWFNNRDFEYVQRPEEHFLVHFVGGPKEKLKRAFCKRLGLNKYIVPDHMLRELNVSKDDDGA
jgi:hypothetical protein